MIRYVFVVRDLHPLLLAGLYRRTQANSLVSVYAEVRGNHCLRSFELSRELDTTAIDASLKDDVLTLRLPKLEWAKPRRIDVRVTS